MKTKLMKSGGMYPVYEVAAPAEFVGISCQIGTMVESRIASAAGVHVALAKYNIISTEISGPTKFVKEPGNLRYNLPFVEILDKPGLGIEVDETTLKELTIKKAGLSYRVDEERRRVV